MECLQEDITIEKPYLNDQNELEIQVAMPNQPISVESTDTSSSEDGGVNLVEKVQCNETDLMDSIESFRVFCTTIGDFASSELISKLSEFILTLSDGNMQFFKLIYAEWGDSKSGRNDVLRKRLHDLQKIFRLKYQSH